MKGVREAGGGRGRHKKAADITGVLGGEEFGAGRVESGRVGAGWWCGLSLPTPMEKQCNVLSHALTPLLVSLTSRARQLM